MTRARDNSSLVGQKEHFVVTESDSDSPPNIGAYGPNFKDGSFITVGRYGTILGSTMFPDGKASIVGVVSYANTGGEGIYIYTLGNKSAGNDGFTTLSWSNEDGSVTGSVSRANMTYSSQTPSSTSRWSRRWQLNYGGVGTQTTFTGTNPESIADDGYIKLVFS